MNDKRRMEIMEQSAEQAEYSVLCHFAEMAGFDTERFDDDKYMAEAEKACFDMMYKEEDGCLYYKDEAMDIFLEEYDRSEEVISMLFKIGDENKNKFK